MVKKSILTFIKELNRTVFTTREAAMLSGRSLSNTSKMLRTLEKRGLVLKIARGIWAEAGNEKLSPYGVIPLLLPKNRAYVSFISALHLHGIMEQIPQEITLASTVHTKKIYTKIGTFSIHRISPSLFEGFDWYKGERSFLIAEPEKALVDSLYISTRKKKQFGYFPELYFPESFSFKKAAWWVARISNKRMRSSVEKKLKGILNCKLFH
jgi:predicted transcriptional regulator of viral defense system